MLPVSALLEDRKRTRLNSSHTEIYTLSYTTLFRSSSTAAPGSAAARPAESISLRSSSIETFYAAGERSAGRSEEDTSELQSHRDLHSFLHDALPIFQHRCPRVRRGEAGREYLSEVLLHRDILCCR